MSYYRVCVVIPGDRLPDIIDESSMKAELGKILEPYNSGTIIPAYKGFVDLTEQFEAEYRNALSCAVEYPDGRILSVDDPEFSKRFCVIDDTIAELTVGNLSFSCCETEASRQLRLIIGQPVRELMTFEQFCDLYAEEYENVNGRWGFYGNPNAKWQRFEIGMASSSMLLVRDSAQNTLCRYPGGYALQQPDGYRYVNGAFMRDICWSKMRELKIATAKADYEMCRKAFQAKDISGLGCLVSLFPEGIYGPFSLLYFHGETLEEHMNRYGFSPSDTHPVYADAFVTAEGKWVSPGLKGRPEHGPFEAAMRKWLTQIQRFTEQISEGDYVVLADYEW